MNVTISTDTLRESTWNEYATRFLFGGLTTVLAGVIATTFGPVVGGLFLAFPAIFPASATLVEKHEAEKKEKHGLKGQKRGRDSAGAEAAGAVMGSM
jgi:hypothetical protein